MLLQTHCCSHPHWTTVSAILDPLEPWLRLGPQKYQDQLHGPTQQTKSKTKNGRAAPQCIVACNVKESFINVGLNASLQEESLTYFPLQCQKSWAAI